MEFQFGTNWAGYSRFVGDIFGAPLAAGLVALGTVLSAFWILVANSWMLTPAGPDRGRRAVLTDVRAAFLNASTLPRFAHTISAALLALPS